MHHDAKQAQPNLQLSDSCLQVVQSNFRHTICSHLTITMQSKHTTYRRPTALVHHAAEQV